MNEGILRTRRCALQRLCRTGVRQGSGVDEHTAGGLQLRPERPHRTAAANAEGLGAQVQEQIPHSRHSALKTSLFRIARHPKSKQESLLPLSIALISEQLPTGTLLCTLLPWQNMLQASSEVHCKYDKRVLTSSKCVARVEPSGHATCSSR